MRNPDEIDLEILRLLVEDARRPFKEIADRVNLSPPAVSDRVDRLQELGIIRTFTADIDRTKLNNRVPVLLQLITRPDMVETVYDNVAALEDTEHIFQLYDGTIIATVTAPDRDVHAWFRDAVDLSAIESYELSPIATADWRVGINPADFSLQCVVCDNEVKRDGDTVRIDGEIKSFCCPSCKALYEERLEALQEAVE